MEINKLIILLLLLAPCWGQAQDGCYVVFFRDKNNATVPPLYSIDKPSAFLSQKSIIRRQHQGIAVVREDLPVNPSYINAITSLNIPVRYTLRWVNGALIEVTSEHLKSIKLLPFVVRTEYVAPLGISTVPDPMPPIKEVSPYPKKDNLYNINQLRMMDLENMHAGGVHGKGVTIAVLDGGFAGVDKITAFAPLFRDNRIATTYNFVKSSSQVYGYSNHGTQVLSIMAADLFDIYKGGASKAIYHLYVTEDINSEYRIEEYNWMAAAEQADSTGADIITSSLGYNLFDDTSMNYTKEQLDGKTAVVSQAAKKALSKGIMVVVSVGNEGNKDWKLMTMPADVDGVIAVGSITDRYLRSTFSSTGPTADGRIKPDVMALGEHVLVMWHDGTLKYANGTSLATPFVASLAAGLLQVYPHLTPKRLYDKIVNPRIYRMAPNNKQGYGIASYSTISYPSVVAIRPPKDSKVDSQSFILYPNLVSNYYITIYLSSYYQHINTPVVLSVYTVQGRNITNSKIENYPSGGRIRYDISTLSLGTYVIKIMCIGKQEILHFVKF